MKRIFERTQQEIQYLKTKFAELKSATCAALNEAGITTFMLFKKVKHLPVQLEEQEKRQIQKDADKLICIPIDPEFFEYLFSLWDYMNPDIYDYLIEEFSLTSLHPLLKAYQDMLNNFQLETPPDLFCEIENTRKQNIISPRGYTQRGILGNPSCFPQLSRVESLRRALARSFNVHPSAVVITNMHMTDNAEAIDMEIMTPDHGASDQDIPF